MQTRSTIPPLPTQPDGVEVKHIPGYFGYAITSDGNVLSCRLGGYKIVYRPDWRILKPKIKQGYPYCEVRLKGKMSLVHRLVLLAFNGPCPENMECRHINGDPSDNRLQNLEWNTHDKNQKDRHTHGTTPRGQSHGMSKLTEEIVMSIKSGYDGSRMYASVVAKNLGINAGHVRRILRGALWSHV